MSREEDYLFRRKRAVFARWVRAYRAHLGLTQEQMAHHLGITRIALLRWENEQTYPRLPTRIRLNDQAMKDGYEAIPVRY